ncbi:hypothetical protein ACPA9J_21535 [Pseudomonas aeruginosa]
MAWAPPRSRRGDEERRRLRPVAVAGGQLRLPRGGHRACPSRCCLMPRCQAGLSLDLPVAMALRKLAEWGGQPLPIVRPATTAKPCAAPGGAARARYARHATASCGEALDDGFWADLREQRLPFFDDPRPLAPVAAGAGAGDAAARSSVAGLGRGAALAEERRAGRGHPRVDRRPWRPRHLLPRRPSRCAVPAAIAWTARPAPGSQTPARPAGHLNPGRMYAEL